MGFSVDIDFGNGLDVNGSKMTERLDEDDKQNEIEGGGGDTDHMKESQEASNSIEGQGPRGLAGLIADLSGVKYLDFVWKIDIFIEFY